MTLKRERPPGASSFASTLISKMLVFFDLGSQFFFRLRSAAERRAEIFTARLGLRMLLQLWISIGIFMALLGIFDLLIDFAGIPRGLVYLFGGVFIALVALLLAHFVKKESAVITD